MRSIATMLVIASAVTACGRTTGDVSVAEPSRPTAAPTSDRERPPSVVLTSPDGSTRELEPFTYCYGSVCADGLPPEPLPDVGSPQQLLVGFPLEGWSFTAVFRPAGEDCGREQQVSLARGGDGRFVLRPAGYADTYEVTLFGRGDGDVLVGFKWTTPTDGPLPEPEARLAVLADHDGTVDSYGIELRVENLAQTPDEARAVITVRADDGEQVTFEATRGEAECWPDGTLYWDGPDEMGKEAATVGPGPFTYQVELVLDGERYLAEATWPEDVIEGSEPSVALEFTPDLPALG